MKFSESIDRWYADLCEHARQSYPALQSLRRNVDLYPVKRNLASVRAMAELITDHAIRSALLVTIDTLECYGRRGTREFRFTFHTYPRWQGGRQCSVCGSLFSSIRQAIDYYK